MPRSDCLRAHGPGRARVRVVLSITLLAAVATGCRTSEPRLRYGAIPVAAASSPPEAGAGADGERAGDDRRLEYAIYTPPDFHPAERLPLVVFLHGAGDGEECFDRMGVGRHLDAAMTSGEVPRAVIVVPRGDLGFWENWVDGSYRYRDWVVRSLMPEIQAQYATAPCPEGCHLIGISMGGHGAVRFQLFEPGLFASVTAVSAPILDTEMALELANESLLRFLVPTARIWGPGTRESVEAEDVFLRWRRPEDLAGTRLMLAWGEGDHAAIVDSNRRFDEHLRASGIPHETLVFPGGHNWSAWTPALDRVLAVQVGGRASHPTERSARAHTK